MGRVAAGFEDIVAAIEEGRLRIDTTTGMIETTRQRLAAAVHTPVRWRPVKFEMVKGPHQRTGYFRFSFVCSLGAFRCLAHRAIWFAAGRTIPVGAELNHRDGNKSRNGIDNLELLTPAGNVRHALDTGLTVPRRGFRGPKAKLDDEAVRSIRQSTETEEVLAARFAISQGQISRVRTRKTYRHVSD